MKNTIKQVSKKSLLSQNLANQISISKSQIKSKVYSKTGSCNFDFLKNTPSLTLVSFDLDLMTEYDVLD